MISATFQTWRAKRRDSEAHCNRYTNRRTGLRSHVEHKEGTGGIRLTVQSTRYRQIRLDGQRDLSEHCISSNRSVSHKDSGLCRVIRLSLGERDPAALGSFGLPSLPNRLIHQSAKPSSKSFHYLLQSYQCPRHCRLEKISTAISGPLSTYKSYAFAILLPIQTTSTLIHQSRCSWSPIHPECTDSSPRTRPS
mgnify:CR=1 FL=1